MESKIRKDKEEKVKKEKFKPYRHNALGFKFCKFEMDFADRAIRNSNRFMERFGKGKQPRDIGAEVSEFRGDYIRGELYKPNWINGKRVHHRQD